MSDQDDNETQGVVFGVLAAVVLGVIALVSGVAIWKTAQTSQPAAIVAEAEVVPVGEALAKVYFAVGEATLNAADQAVVGQTLATLAAKPQAIVLLSGFHDPSGDPARNAELAKARAQAVRDALVGGGVAVERIKFRKPESTLGSGSPEEGRRVEIRVQ